MPNDTRELPAANDGLSRFLGGSPLAVAFRLILLSVLVGVVLCRHRLRSLEHPQQHPAAVRAGSTISASTPSTGLWRYFLLGAVIVIPIWLLSRLFGAPRGR